MGTLHAIGGGSKGLNWQASLRCPMICVADTPASDCCHQDDSSRTYTEAPADSVLDVEYLVKYWGSRGVTLHRVRESSRDPNNSIVQGRGVRLMVACSGAKSVLKA